MSEPAPGVAPVPVPRGAVLLTVLGLVVQGAGCFAPLPLPVLSGAMLASAAGAAWLAAATRRWQLGLAAVWMTWRCAEPFVLGRAQSAGGTGALLVLVAFAVLVLGGAWVGRRDATS